MSTVLEIFKEITKIPRCSGVHKEFITYMQDLSKKLNYLCLVDEKIIFYVKNRIVVQI